MEPFEELHDHCRCCHSKYCDFDVVEGVSCSMTPCANDCGQKLHECKQHDHDIICLNTSIDCINKQYGCPMVLFRRDLARHLNVCPANVVICMMEWNRWHRGSSQSSSIDRRIDTKKLQDLPVLHRDLDLALALHDQRVLIETIMPGEVLRYYSDLADRNSNVPNCNNGKGLSHGKPSPSNSSADYEVNNAGQNDKIQSHKHKGQNDTSVVHDGASCNSVVHDGGGCNRVIHDGASGDRVAHDGASCNKVVQNGLDTACCSFMNTNDHKVLTNENSSHSDGKSPKAPLSVSANGNEKSITNHLRKYVDVVKKKKLVAVQSSGSMDVDWHVTNGYTQCNDETSSLPPSETFSNAVAKTHDKKRVLPYNGLFSQPCVVSGNNTPHTMHVENGLSSSEAESSPYSNMLKEIKDVDACIQEFADTAPQFMTLLNTLDSDVCAVVDTVDFLVSTVVAQDFTDDNTEAEVPALEWNDNNVGLSAYADQEQRSDELRRSIDEMLQEFGVVCEMSLDPSSSSTAEERRQRRRSERRKRSWLFNSGVTGGPLTSWGWNPKKDTKDASTDTSDLVIDRSNLEWLSPEASVSRTDLISRLFSIIGASYRGDVSLFEHKQTTPFMSDTSSQTVAPFLLHLDMNAIGRALCSYSLISSRENFEERGYILSLLSDGHTEKIKDDYAPMKISDNLAFHNIALDSIVESVPRYQTKPSSMFSFMCGCVLRRDQFASHVRNVHCEIMSGLNGWIEEKCPYAAFGCEHSQPRFCPNRHSDAIVFNQTQNCFAVKPGHWDRPSSGCNPSTPSSSINLLELPYEIHEKIFRYLDNVSMNQMSQTCTYLREVCEAHLTRRGIVKTEWRKRTYEDGTQSWKMEKHTWSFTSSFTEINRWVLSDSPAMVQHVSRCPVAAAYVPKYRRNARYQILASWAARELKCERAGTNEC